MRSDVTSPFRKSRLRLAGKVEWAVGASQQPVWSGSSIGFDGYERVVADLSLEMFTGVVRV
jgi:hypothetical protein